MEVEFVVQCGLTFGDSAPQRVKKPKWGKTEMTTLLIVTSDMVFVDFRRIAWDTNSISADQLLISFFDISTKALNEKKEFTLTAQFTKPSQLINAYIASVFNLSFFFRCQATYKSVGKVRWRYHCADVSTKRFTRQVSNTGNSTIDINCTFVITSGPY